MVEDIVEQAEFAFFYLLLLFLSIGPTGRFFAVYRAVVEFLFG